MAARIVRPVLTIERLKSRLTYDPNTGVFVWLKSCQGTLAGAVAGTTDDDGRINIVLDYVRHKAYRLAWFYVTGSWPKQSIDHINGVASDNRFCNLREASQQQNNTNLHKARKHNKTGLLGAQWRKDKNKYRSRIVCNGVEHFLGYFATAEAAHAAYLKAKRRLHPFGDIAKDAK